MWHQQMTQDKPLLLYYGDRAFIQDSLDQCSQLSSGSFSVTAYRGCTQPPKDINRKARSFYVKYNKGRHSQEKL